MSTTIKSPHRGGNYASWGFYNRRHQHNPNSEVRSTNLQCAVWLVNAVSVINLKHFYETQNKIGPDFKIGSTSFSLGLVNSYINGWYQETPALKVLTQPPDIRLNKCFHCIMQISGGSRTKLGFQGRSNSEMFGVDFFVCPPPPKKKNFTKNNLSTYGDSEWFHIVSVLGIIFILLNSPI